MLETSGCPNDWYVSATATSLVGRHRPQPLRSRRSNGALGEPKGSIHVPATTTSLSN